MIRVMTGEFYELPMAAQTISVPLAGTKGFADARGRALGQLGVTPMERFELTRTATEVVVLRRYYITDGCPDA